MEKSTVVVEGVSETQRKSIISLINQQTEEIKEGMDTIIFFLKSMGADFKNNKILHKMISAEDELLAEHCRVHSGLTQCTPSERKSFYLGCIHGMHIMGHIRNIFSMHHVSLNDDSLPSEKTNPMASLRDSIKRIHRMYGGSHEDRARLELFIERIKEGLVLCSNLTFNNFSIFMNNVLMAEYGFQKTKGFLPVICKQSLFLSADNIGYLLVTPEKNESPRELAFRVIGVYVMNRHIDIAFTPKSLNRMVSNIENQFIHIRKKFAGNVPGARKRILEIMRPFTNE